MKYMENQFKIIAIEPLEGCEKRIIKNLKNTIYYFYQGYNINNDIIDIDPDVILSQNFFSNEGTNISVRAIVGKNGSGKSALIELLLRIINNLSYKYFGVEKGSVWESGVKPVLGISANLYYQVGANIYCLNIHDRATEFRTQNDINIYVRKSDSEWREIICSLKKGEIKNNQARLSSEVSQVDVIELQNKSILKQFFYTIIVNYSHYSYNTDEYLEEWIDNSSTPNPERNLALLNNPNVCWYDGLFHKNDGYKTPIVVNPMRRKGLIDINNETHLSVSRLLGLLASVTTGRIKVFNEKNEVSGLKLWYRSNEYWRKLTKQWNEKNLLFEELCVYIFTKWAEIRGWKLNGFSFTTFGDKEKFQYLVYKTITANNTYQDIIDSKVFFSTSTFTDLKASSDYIDNLVKWLNDDKSHITFKIKQTINYIEYTESIYYSYIGYDRILSLSDFTQNIEQLKQNFLKHGVDVCDLSYYAPPPFLKVEIQFRDKTRENSELYPITKLSTGERHFIYSFTTVLYHLKNLDSIPRNLERVSYNNVSIILEENDLYFHPEMQRVQIAQIIEYIQCLNLTHIKNIDLNIVTHSPILLSDIPRQNVLFLKNGEVETVAEPTFGSNIHSLYKHSFFTDLPMGAFAKNKIQGYIDNIDDKEATEEIFKEIQLIGEPIIRNKLLSLYTEKKYPSYENQIQFHKKEIERLEKIESNYDISK